MHSSHRNDLDGDTIGPWASPFERLFGKRRRYSPEGPFPGDLEHDFVELPTGLSGWLPEAPVAPVHVSECEVPGKHLRALELFSDRARPFTFIVVEERAFDNPQCIGWGAGPSGPHSASR